MKPLIATTTHRECLTLLAIDFDKWAASTYAINFPGVRVECGKVSDYVGALPDADVILGGPPCQPFSLAGEGKGENDDRDCIPDFIAAVRKVRPRMFLMENVAGLLNEKHARYLGEKFTELESLGYAVRMRELDAVNFGVPQFRNRCWFWGIRSDLYASGIRHSWPQATHVWPWQQGPSLFGGGLLPAVTVGQALGLHGYLLDERGKGMAERHGARRPIPTTEPAPLIMAGNAGSGCRYKIQIQSHADPARSVDMPAPTLRSGGKGHDGCCLRLEYDHGVAELDAPCPTIKAGGNIDASGKQGGGCPPIIEYRWSDAMLQKHPPASPASPAPTVQAKWFKGGAEGLLAVDAPCETICGQSREPIQNWKAKGYIRRLMPLECLRLQSGPDNFLWPVKITKTAMYRIAGNGWASRMGAVFADTFARVDPQSRTVIDLFCGGGLGACGWHGRFWSYAPPELEAIP